LNPSRTHPLAPSLRAGKGNVALWFAVAWSALSLLIHSKFFTSPVLLFAQIPAVLDLLCAALIFSLAAKSDESQRHKISCALVVGMGIHALMAAQQYGAAKQAGQDWFRAPGLFFSANFSAGFIALLLPLAFVLCLQAKERLAALGFGLISALAFGALIASGSRVGGAAAVLGLLVALVLANPIAAVRRGELNLQRLGVLVLACLALGFGFKGAIVSRGTKTGGQTDTTRKSPFDDPFRLWTWRGTVKMATSNPVFGTGPGTFSALYPRYAQVKLTGHAHQSYLQLAAESGIPALLGAVIAIVATVFSSPLRGAGGGLGGRLLSGALLGGLLAALLRSFFDSEWSILGNALPFWTVLGLLVSQSSPSDGGRGGSLRIPAALGLLLALLNQAGIYPPQPRPLAEAGKFAEAAELEPTPRWHFRIARLAEQQGRFAEAVTAFEKAREADPNDLATLRALAETKERAGDTDGAQAIWRQLIAVSEGPAGKYRAISETTELAPAYAYAALEQWERCAALIIAHSHTEPIYQLQAYNVVDGNLEKARTRHAELLGLFETAMSHLPERRAEKSETQARLDKFFN
ncbi:O-antigen ligase family protein, partial [Armatimonas sp.]|uniref:O-antigen ligase family protein n=1 Tax=Armatimonas sp. TaxID=1872638 RepID=UPI003753B308